jgi:hypothetical protein
MHFRCGALPEETDFQPEAEGWVALREPDPVTIQFLAMPVALGILILLGGGLYAGGLRKIEFTAIPPLGYVGLLLWLPVHEGLHGLCHPHWGFSERTVLGFWPQRGVLYAYYAGPRSRTRVLVSLAAPVIASLLMVGSCVAFKSVLSMAGQASLALLALFNGALASGDLISFGVLFLQVPVTAQVRNRGWRTFWKFSLDHSA